MNARVMVYVAKNLFLIRDVCIYQTLIDVFYLPLVRWVEQRGDCSPIGGDAITRTGACRCPSIISRAEIEAVFLNIDKLIIFSRFVKPQRRRVSTLYLLSFVITTPIAGVIFVQY